MKRPRIVYLWWTKNGKFGGICHADPKDKCQCGAVAYQLLPRKPAARRKVEPLKHAGENCWCSPRVEDYCGRKIVIHNEEQ